MMCAIVVLFVAVLLLSAVSSVVAATDLPSDAISVRVLRSTEAFDHNLCRRLAGEAYPALPREHGRWPDLWPDSECYRQNETLVAVSDGLVVGRAILEARYQPCCELVNICVRPDYRNQGAATALVREAITRARSMGFKVMFVQEYRNDAQAHGIYLKVGFVPATRGDMLRLVKLLDVPAVSNFLTAHPNAVLTSEAAPAAGERWWRLVWADGPHSVALALHGGSCQGDSDGFQPVLQGCDLVDGDLSLSARVEANEQHLAPGEVVEITMAVRNAGAAPFAGLVRAVLLPGMELAVDQPPTALHLDAGQEQRVALPIRLAEARAVDLAAGGFLSYRSIPLTLELCWADGSMILSVPVKVG